MFCECLIIKLLIEPVIGLYRPCKREKNHVYEEYGQANPNYAEMEPTRKSTYSTNIDYEDYLDPTENTYDVIPHY